VADNVMGSIAGVSIVPESCHSPSAMVEAADRILYNAKQNGRSRLVTGLIAPPALESSAGVCG